MHFCRGQEIPKPPKGEDNFNAMRAPNDGYALDVADEEMGDYKVASWAIEQWKTVTEKPLFMSVGFFRPHRPLQVPKPWFDQFPLESIRRPAEPEGEDDWADMPDFARKLARSHAHKPMHNGLSDHEYIVANDQWDATIRAYHASVAFVDRQIGRFLDSLKENPRGRETFVMLVSDHGWHLGEKKHWCKGAIWEQTTHIPFIVRGPGVEAGSKCTQPVSLIDVYPSLVDLAGLEIPDWLDGTSIKPQLAEPSSPRPPAISSYGEGNTSIRTERWRYIRYEDGSEELYDHRVDPDEWTNLANKPEHEETKKKLAQMIPVESASGAESAELVRQVSEVIGADHARFSDRRDRCRTKSGLSPEAYMGASSVKISERQLTAAGSLTLENPRLCALRLTNRTPFRTLFLSLKEIYDNRT